MKSMSSVAILVALSAVACSTALPHPHVEKSGAGEVTPESLIREAVDLEEEKTTTFATRVRKQDDTKEPKAKFDPYVVVTMPYKVKESPSTVNRRNSKKSPNTSENKEPMTLILNDIRDGLLKKMGSSPPANPPAPRMSWTEKMDILIGDSKSISDKAPKREYFYSFYTYQADPENDHVTYNIHAPPVNGMKVTGRDVFVETKNEYYTEVPHGSGIYKIGDPQSAKKGNSPARGGKGTPKEKSASRVLGGRGRGKTNAERSETEEQSEI